MAKINSNDNGNFNEKGEKECQKINFYDCFWFLLYLNFAIEIVIAIVKVFLFQINQPHLLFLPEDSKRESPKPEQHLYFLFCRL